KLASPLPDPPRRFSTPPRGAVSLRARRGRPLEAPRRRRAVPCAPSPSPCALGPLLPLELAQRTFPTSLSTAFPSTSRIELSPALRDAAATSHGRRFSLPTFELPPSPSHDF